MATILGDLGLVGRYGTSFAEFNLRYFGALSYLYPFALLYPLYHLYHEQSLTLRRIELVLSFMLLFFCLLLMQALIFKIPFDGMIGRAIIRLLYPLIGMFGIWLIIATGIFLAGLMFFNQSIEGILAHFRGLYLKMARFLAAFWQTNGESSEESPKSQDLQKAPEQKQDKKLGDEKLEESEPLNDAPLINEATEESAPLAREPQKESITQDTAIEASTSHCVELHSMEIPMQFEEEDNYAKLVRLIKKPKTTELTPSTSFQITQESALKSHTHSLPNNAQERKSELVNKEDLASSVSPTSPDFKEATHDTLSDSLLENTSHTFTQGIPSKTHDSQPKAPLYTTSRTATLNEAKNPAQNAQKASDSPVIIKELEENIALLSTLDFGESSKPKGFKLPHLDFLQKPSGQHVEIDEDEIDRKIQDLLGKLKMFKIEGDIARTYSGPIVTTFEFRPAPSVKVSRILTLEDDLAMALKAKTIRIQAPVPGKDVVGIEIPNKDVETIYLREILESELFLKSSSPLTLALGKDIVGKPFITDLKKLPHLLIAGTTGSGKSVGINAMILSLLYKNSPDDLKLIMIDPKMLEFSIYNDIPHLLTPVITQPKKAITALGNTVAEMERRYEAMSKAKTKNIENYNDKARKEGFAPFPYIVVIIDELADLMMTGGKDVEYSIARLAQMARASGIHLIVATQRPSVDIVTGLIKANLPSRISYKVGQKIDSKVILDSFGAESLLGRGDMLFTPPGGGGIVRLHAPWSSETEIEKIVEYLKSQRVAEYDESFLGDDEEGFVKAGSSSEESGDELYEEAKRIILSDKKTSISYIQRRLSIGYNKAANIIDEMEKRGFLSPPNSKGNRDIIGT
ncbi:MAG: DNA translocase FtsK 4TM domain-containing protein [Wolinella sp.]